MRIGDFCSLFPDRFAMGLVDIIDPNVGLTHAKKSIEKLYNISWAFKNRLSRVVKDFKKIEGLVFELIVFWTECQVLPV